MGKSTKTCKACKAEVDRSSKVCQACGARMKMIWWKKILVAFGSIFALLIVIGLFSDPVPSTTTTAVQAKTVEKTPEQIASEKLVADAKAKADADAKVISDKAAADAKVIADKVVADAAAKTAAQKVIDDAAKAKADAAVVAQQKADEAKKAQALIPKFIAYKELARNPDSYMGTMVKFTGEVIQVQESGDLVNLRVDVTKGAYDIYSDTVMLQYDKSLVSGRVLTDDIISFTGESLGLLTYKTVMGAEMTIPQILGKTVSR